MNRIADFLDFVPVEAMIVIVVKGYNIINKKPAVKGSDRESKFDEIKEYFFLSYHSERCQFRISDLLRSIKDDYKLYTYTIKL